MIYYEFSDDRRKTTENTEGDDMAGIHRQQPACGKEGRAETERRMVVEKVKEEEVRRTEGIRIEEERRQKEVRKLEELRRAEQIHN